MRFMSLPSLTFLTPAASAAWSAGIPGTGIPAALISWTAPANPSGWDPVNPGIPKESSPKNLISWFWTSVGMLTGGGGGGTEAPEALGMKDWSPLATGRTGCWAAGGAGGMAIGCWACGTATALSWAAVGAGAWTSDLIARGGVTYTHHAEGNSNYVKLPVQGISACASGLQVG